MALNTLTNQTATGVQPKKTGFETFQTTLKNLKQQQPATALGNFYNVSKKTTGNVQQQGQQVNQQTEAQKQLYSDDKIKKMMDDLKTKASGQMKTTESTLGEKAKSVGTVSFPGSPSDEQIKGLMDGTYKAETNKTPEQLDADLNKASADLADGKIDDPAVKSMFASLLTDDIEGQATKALQNMFEAVNGKAAAKPEPPPDIGAINTDTDWASGYTTAENARNASLEELRKQAIADLLGIDYGVAEDVTPKDVWTGQLADPSQYENLAYAQSQLLENPNSTPESVYGALGLSQTGNAYFDTLNREAARSGALNAMREAEGTTASRGKAQQDFTRAKKDYGTTMQDIESRWDTQAAATKGELDKQKTAAKTGIETKDIGKKTEEQIAAKAKSLADAEAKAKGIKATNAKNSEYMDLLKKNRALYEKQVADEVKAQKRVESSKTLQDRGYKEEADALLDAAESSGQTPEQIEKTLDMLTEEELNKYVASYGNAADNVGTVNKILGAAALAIPGLNGSGLATLGGLIAQKVLSGKQKKYQAELDRRKALADAIKFRDSPENIKKHEGIKKERDTEQKDYESRGSKQEQARRNKKPKETLERSTVTAKGIDKILAEAQFL